jgi:hypothetical protein
MGMNRTDEFRKDAVRIALTSGLKRRGCSWVVLILFTEAHTMSFGLAEVDPCEERTLDVFLLQYGGDRDHAFVHPVYCNLANWLAAAGRN